MYVVGQYKDKIINTEHVQCFYVDDKADEDKKISVIAFLNKLKVVIGTYVNPIQVVAVMAELLEFMRATDEKSVYEMPMDAYAYQQQTEPDGKQEAKNATD